MKRTKKLLALVLAMVMAFSLMAVTAAAYGAEEHEHTHVCSEETIQPRLPAVRCPKCGTVMDAWLGPNAAGETCLKLRCPVDGTYDELSW